MKNKIAVFLTALALASCTVSAPNTPASIEDTQKSNLPSGLEVWTDPVTGCDWFAPYGGTQYGMTPRTSSDGFHQLCAEQKK